MGQGSRKKLVRITGAGLTAGMLAALVPIVAAGPAAADAADLRITEVWPGGSSSAYGGDWFEVTNTGTDPVDLTGWKVDDSSNAFASAIALNGVTTIAAGQSVVFIEAANPAVTVPAFTTAWFGSDAPADLVVGTYTGSGIGLSGTADAVNLFDSAGAPVTGVSFGAAGSNVTFDNAVGATGAIATLSTVGANGAFVSANGIETGSPGRVTDPAPDPDPDPEPDPGPGGIDLSQYVRVGRYDLPSPTNTTPPAGSLLAQEVSAATYNPDTDSLFLIGDGSTSVVQVDKAGQLIDSMTLALGSSPQGTEFYDTEGLTYVGNGQFVLAEERDRQVSLFTYVPGTTLTRADVQTVDLGTFSDNIGIEGISWDPLTSGLVAVKEITPLGVFQTDVDFAAGTATNGSATTENSVNLFDPALIGMSDLADVYALSNLPSLAELAQEENLLLLSQEEGRIVNIGRDGAIASSLTIVTDPGNPLSVPNQQHEGLTMDHDGNLYVVSENGGGSIADPQLWVYAPSAVPNAAPTAVELTNSISPVLENTTTVLPLKVADVQVTDDGLGTNQLTVSGPDAAAFEVDSNGLYVRAGTVLDFEAQATYSVTVEVDDTSIGATPDAVSTTFTLELTDVEPEGTAAAGLVVSEVSPWSSGSAPYGADWFELTNTSGTSVSLAGWKVDDNSNAFANAVALSGVTTLGAGQSAVFVEGDATTAAAFTAAWFGASPPAGLVVGSYSGGGVGLSTGGDSVNVFDASGNRVTGVSFGIAVTGQTFDNTAGLGSTTLPLPAVTALSQVGVNGAFTAVDGIEIGSPGRKFDAVAVTEVSPWSSGDAPYAADWFELTNTGTTPLDLTGWKMDDSSASPVGAVALLGVTTLAPGASAVFVEGDAAKAEALKAAWFGSAVPAGFTIGTYGGSGVGLGTGGDAVNVFDAIGRRVTSVDFGAATTGRTFDNVAARTGTISTLSTVGVDGAFTAADGIEVGSPGRLVNLAPTGVTLAAPVTSLPEDTDTAAPVRVADVVVADDGLDPFTTTLSGPDAALFEVTGGVLSLKAGTVLDAETDTTLEVTVEVDDTTVGASPDVSASLVVAVTGVNEAPSATDDSGFSTSRGKAVRIPIAALLGNDTDPDAGTALQVVPNGFSEVVGGSVAVNGTDVVFTPSSSFTGTASFRYTTTDGTLTDTAKVTVQVKESPIVTIVKTIISIIKRLFGR